MVPTEPPRIRRPKKGQMLRNMNKDLLLGLLIPGPDRFEVRGWVRWLVGDPGKHVPEDPVDRARFMALSSADDASVAALREAALEAVAAETTGDDAFRRGCNAHDHLMRTLLSDASNLDALRLAALSQDKEQLLAMLEVSQEDLDDPRFHEGFAWANHRLAEAVAAQLDQ